MKFTKMEGCGNDYIYINCFEEKIDAPSALSIKMSNRNFGVGSDGIVLIMPDETCDFRMRMFNADGSEAEMCGNASRCIGKYVYDRGLTDKTTVTLNTLAGIKVLKLNLKDGVVDTVTVDMGEPVLKADLIPVISNRNPVIDEKIIADGREFGVTCVSTGNPHAVTFVADTDSFDVKGYGSILEVDSHFPRKSNIEFIQVIDRKNVKMRVWERGSGETLACGTGACAATVACILNGFTDRKINLKLLGGNLSIEWNENDNRIYMTGPAAFCFDGVWLK